MLKKFIKLICYILIILITLNIFQNTGYLNLIEESKADVTDILGIDSWQGVHLGSVPGQLDNSHNIINQSTANIKYNYTTAVTLTFNGSACANGNYYLYKPFYRLIYGDCYGVFWVREGNCSAIYAPDGLQKDVIFDRAGLWLVLPKNLPANINLNKVEMSNMSYYDSDVNGWHNITGWFWVNHSHWELEVSPSTAIYDHNDSVTITIKDSDGNIVDNNYIWVDIWLLDNSSDIDDKGAKLIYTFSAGFHRFRRRSNKLWFRKIFRYICDRYNDVL